MNPILIPIFLPIIAAPALFLLRGRAEKFREAAVTAVMLATFVVSASLFKIDAVYSLPWASFGFDFALKLYPLANFALCAITAFALLVTLYSWAFMKGKPHTGWFYFNCLITLGFANGAVLADNLVLLLFFWEGLLVSLYLFLALSKDDPQSKMTAMKAFIINGAGDLCLLSGVGLAGYLTGTMDISLISLGKIPLAGWGLASYILLMIGAVAKAGAFPFHTWIPDAATDAQVPFMAFLPSSIEKILGVYLLTKLSVELFAINTSPAAQMTLLVLGALTLLITASMALVQKDFKRLLGYQTVSQLGYMLIGIGTGTPLGIAGALFHMLNHAAYKTCLFMTSGNVEKATGSTELSALGGLAKSMPVTAVIFIIAAASACGIAPTGAFFSKELVYEAAKQSGNNVFFIIAEIGSFITLLTFIKVGHAIFFGKENAKLSGAKEAPALMLVPAGILALACLAFGFGGRLPLHFFIEPSLSDALSQGVENLGGFHFNALFALAVGIIAAAAAAYWFGLKKTGKAASATDYIEKAPGFRSVYALAEKRVFDPYEQGLRALFAGGRGLFVVDRVMDFLTDTLPAAITGFAAGAVSRAHTGMYPHYIAYSLLGLIAYALIVYYGGVMP